MMMKQRKTTISLKEIGDRFGVFGFCPLVIHDHLLGHYGEAGGEDDDPFYQVFQLLQALQAEDIRLRPIVNT